MPLTSTGLTTPTLLEILDAIKADQRANIDPELDLSPASPDGQNDAIFARQLRKAYEALTTLYTAGNPNGAVGVQLDYLAALTGTTRRGQTYSRLTTTANVDPGTYAAGTLVVYPDTRPGDTFTNVTAVVNSGGATASIAGVVFQADEPGVVLGPASQLFISTPVSGWNFVTFPSSVQVGLDTETDSELRARRLFEVSAQGSTTVDAIAADISRDVAGVIQVEVIENASNETVDTIPPHSFEAVVYGPTSDDQEVARQIFESKAAGIRAYGTTTEVVQDSFGVDHSIGFTRPTAVPAAVTLYANTRHEPTVEEEDAVRALIVERAAALRVGDNLDWSEVVGWVMSEVPGILRVTDVLIGPAAGPVVSFAVLSISRREIATVALGNVVVDMSQGTP